MSLGRRANLWRVKKKHAFVVKRIAFFIRSYYIKATT
jgi:hypothetical protein